MAHNVRLCLLSPSGEFLKIEDEQLTGTNTYAPKYSGSAGAVFNTNIATMFQRDKLNYTAVHKPTVGYLDLATGYYNRESCLYSLQTNESDFSIAIASYPVPGKNLKHLPAFSGDSVHMLSRYNVSSDIYDADVMSVFAYAFQPEVWILFALLSLFAWIIIKVHLKLVHKLRPNHVHTRDDSLYELLTHLFQVETIDYDGPSMRVVSLFVSILSFLFLTYFTVSMKTDIVVVEEPKIIHNYDDLLADPQAKMIFPKLVDTIADFKYAEPNTKEKMVWEKSLKLVKGDLSKLDYKVFGASMMDVIKFGPDLAFSTEEQNVICLPEIGAGAARKILCLLKILFSRSTSQQAKDILKLHLWLSKDPNAKETILTWPYSAFYDSPYLKTVTKRVAWANALGVMPMQYKSGEQQHMNAIAISGQQEGDLYRSCLADDFHLNMPHVDLAEFSPKQFKILFIACAGILIMSFLAYTTEQIQGSLLHRRNPRFNLHMHLREQRMKFNLQREIHLRRLRLRARGGHLGYTL